MYSSDRVSEEVVMDVEETLRTKPVVQKMFLQVKAREGKGWSAGLPALASFTSFPVQAVA